MSGSVRPKKNLGQHFLQDEAIVQNIVEALPPKDSFDLLIEVGPGEGVMTKYLAPLYDQFMVVEYDSESVDHILANGILPPEQIFQGDFLRWNFPDAERIMVIGNFPYNISSQIVFKLLENRDKVVGMVGMFQKEVAQRIASPPGNKSYGILSVFTQAWFDLEYLFSVDEHAFRPAPKVKSGVIRMTRKEGFVLGCDEKRFRQVVKMAFNQRRKMLRNSIAALIHPDAVEALEPYLKKRPEQLDFTDFTAIVNALDAVK